MMPWHHSVKNNGLAEAYAKIVEDFGHEPTPLARRVH